MPAPRPATALLRAPVALLVALLLLGGAAPLANAGGHHGHRPSQHHGTKQKSGTKHGPADPRTKRGLYVDPEFKAANAGAAFAGLGRRAQPLWITDYYRSPDAARDAVTRYLGLARGAGKTGLLTIYNIPDRDCGGYSAQQVQISGTYYRGWIDQVAAGVRGNKPIVILEPDALPFYGNPDCTSAGDRVALVRYAARKLSNAGAWVYIDAGHSGWQSPEHMAPLLKAAGIAYARGFSDNVANTRSTAAETTFATTLVKDLARLHVRGVHYVMDTSRNGGPDSTRPANGDTCNPTSAKLGLPPQLLFRGAFDGRLWVKLPGESDGPCNGGPNSGEFFPTGACRLLGTPSSYYDEGSRTCR